MYVYQIKINSILEQDLGKTRTYYVYKGCDGAYGKFIEITRDGELVNEGPGAVNYQCGATLDALKLKIIKEPELAFDFKKLLENIKNFFKK